VEQINQYFLNQKANVLENWRTYLFDAFFIAASFTFIPVFGLITVLLDEKFFADKDDFPSQIKLVFSVMPFVIIIACRIGSLYLKRFSVRKQNRESASSARILKWNKVAIFFSYLGAFVPLLGIMLSKNPRDSEVLIALIKLASFAVLLLLPVAIFIEYILFLKINKPVTFKEESRIKRWLGNPLVEFISNCLLFVYILFYQREYYQYLQGFFPKRILANIYNFDFNVATFISLGLAIAGLFLAFLYFYVAPRMIYSQSYNEEGNNWSMVCLVFISTNIGLFLPLYLAWLF